MILYMYIVPGQGLTTAWGRNFYVSRNNLSLLSFVASFKNVSFKSDFIHSLFMVWYMYIAPGQGQRAPRGQSFDVNRNVLSLHSFFESFKKCLWSLILYIFFMIKYMYRAPGQFDIDRKALSLYSFVASFFEVWFYTFFSWFNTYSPEAEGIQPPEDKVLVPTETSCHFGHLLLVSKHRRQ